jgi:23S rRNA pseudouridine1911/1915/1917 synthase
MSDISQKISLSVCTDCSKRLDRYLAEVFEVSRGMVQQMIQNGDVFVSGEVVTQRSRKVELNMLIECHFRKDAAVIHDGNCEYVEHHHFRYEDIMIPIVYEDDDVLVVNKPAGLVVHPAPTVSDITLTEIIVRAGGHLAEVEGRPGVVHRLDQYTEGVILMAKTKTALELLQDQFRKRQIAKKYYAVLSGQLISDEGTIDFQIGRDVSMGARKSCHHYVPGTQKDALTRFKVIRRLSNLTVVDVDLVTGRTHQIRVHFAAKSVPVFGDSLYSSQNERPEGYYLQSYFICFEHPSTNTMLEFELPMSERLKQYA